MCELLLQRGYKLRISKFSSCFHDRVSDVEVAQESGEWLDGSAITAQRQPTDRLLPRVVVWIVEAKKPETRTARLEKTIAMLSKGKKNPSEK